MMTFKRMIKVVFILLLSSQFTGCATGMWNDKINQQLKPSHDENIMMSHSYGDEAKGYYKGYFNGIKKSDGKEYYNYIIPDALGDPAKYWLDVLIPVGSNDKVAQIKKIEYFTGTNDAIYVQYDRGYNFESMVSNIHKFSSSYNYPTHIQFHLSSYGSGASIWLGQKIDVTNTSSISEEMQGNLYLVCQPPHSYPLVKKLAKKITDVSKDINGNCELWYLSNKFITNPYEGSLAKSIGLNVIRVAGCFITVPIDILTSPIQLGVGLYLLHKFPF